MDTCWFKLLGSGFLIAYCWILYWWICCAYETLYEDEDPWDQGYSLDKSPSTTSTTSSTEKDTNHGCQ